MWFLVLSRTAQGAKYLAAFQQGKPVPLFIDDLDVEVIRVTPDITEWVAKTKAKVTRSAIKVGGSAQTTSGFSRTRGVNGGSYQDFWECGFDGWREDWGEECDNCTTYFQSEKLRSLLLDNETWALCPECYTHFAADLEPCEYCGKELDRDSFAICVAGKHVLELCPECLDRVFDTPVVCHECLRVYEAAEVTNIVLDGKNKPTCHSCVDTIVEEERAKALGEDETKRVIDEKAAVPQDAEGAAKTFAELNAKAAAEAASKVEAEKITPERVRAAKSQRGAST